MTLSLLQISARSTILAHMDGLSNNGNQANVAPLGALPGQDRRGPGRPTVSADQRAMNDERYKQVSELWDDLPNDATECRFKIFEAHHRRDVKQNHDPVRTLLASEWRDHGFKERPALEQWLEEEVGEGRFIVEAYDAHNLRITRIPPFIITAGEPENMDERARGGFRRRNRDDYDDDDEDFGDSVDRREHRANLADTLAASVRSQNLVAQQREKDQASTSHMLVITQQKADESRREDERRRREDDMRREDLREDRRREEERAAREERVRMDREEREEDRRRDDQKRAEETARAEERRIEERRADDRRREDFQARMASESEKMKLYLAAIPLLEKIFKPDTSSTTALLATLSKPKDADPIMLMLLKGMMDKSEKGDMGGVFMQQLQTMMAAGQALNQQQLTSMLEFSSNVNKQVMERALKMMMDSPQGQTPEGKSTLEKVIAAVQGAAEIVRTMVPQMAPPQQQQRTQGQFIRHQTAQPQAPAPAQQVAAAPAPAAAAQVIPEVETPTGVAGVMSCMMAIQHYQSGQVQMTQAEYQSVVQALLAEMPAELQLAVLDNDQMSVLTLCRPAMEEYPELNTWVQQPGVLAWVQEFVPALAPHIQQMHGPAEHIRSVMGRVVEEAPAPVAPENTETAPKQPKQQDPQEHPDPHTDPQETLAGPGSAGTNPESHLSGDDV